MGAAGTQQSPDDEGEAERLNTYISCIKNLYSEIEGIIRITLFREKGKKKITFKDLKEFVKDKASSTFISPTTLTFPNEFYNYLDQELFANFDMSVETLIYQNIQVHMASRIQMNSLKFELFNQY